MKHRFYHPPPLEPGQALILGRERAHYLTRVLRLRRDEALVCFDGAGRALRATLADAGPRSATLKLGEIVETAPPPEPAIHLVQGLLKGAAMDLVQKATELGATDIHPVLAERSNVPVDAEPLGRKHEHWLRVIESAAEQCGTLYLPRLHPVRSLDDYLTAPPAAAAILLQPGEPVMPTALERAAVALLIGPEGGWTEAERAKAAAAGAVSYGLGPRILRGETAPLAALAALRHGWGWT